VLAIGAYSFPGKDHDNEDRCVLFPELFHPHAHGPLTYCAVYDGHAGSLTAEYLEHNLHNIIFTPEAQKAFAEPSPPSAEVVVELLRQGFTAAEADVTTLLRQQQDWSGAVCSSVVIYGNKVYVANLGDCRAVLARQGPEERLPTRCHQLSDDHRPVKEKARIEAAGGFVTKDARLCGQLLFSRSFGDREFKYEEDRQARAVKVPSLRSKPKAKAHLPIVSAEPDIRVFDLDPERDAYLIIASDGLWDSISSKRVVALTSQLMRQHTTLAEVASRLEKEARKRGSRDDVTIIIVLLKETLMTPVASPQGVEEGRAAKLAIM